MKALFRIFVANLTRALRYLLLASGAVLLTVSLTPAVHWWSQALAVDWDAGESDVLVVLAGSALDDGILGESSYWRSVFAVQEFRSHPYRRIIISGSNSGPVPVSDSMKKFLEAHGIPGQLIDTEGRSRSTRENAIYTAQLLRDHGSPIVLITSDYHMRRAAQLFRRAGVKVIAHPYPDVEKRCGRLERRWGAAVDLATESTKLLYYRWRGWI